MPVIPNGGGGESTPDQAQQQIRTEGNRSAPEQEQAAEAGEQQQAEGEAREEEPQG